MESQIISSFINQGPMGLITALFVYLYIKERNKSDAFLRELLDTINNNTNTLNALKDVVVQISRNRGDSNG